MYTHRFHTMGLACSSNASAKPSSSTLFDSVRSDLHGTNPEVVEFFERLDECILKYHGVEYTGDELAQHKLKAGQHELPEGWKDRTVPTDTQTIADECKAGEGAREMIYDVYRLADEDAIPIARRPMMAMMAPEDLLARLMEDEAMQVALGASRLSPDDPLPHTVMLNFRIDATAEDMEAATKADEFGDTSDSGEEDTFRDVYAVHNTNKTTGEICSFLYHSPTWTARKVDSLWYVYSRWYTMKHMSNGMWTSPFNPKYQDFRHVAEPCGRRSYSDWTQELLYTFIKVPGAMGLENSRPVGLLEILQKASYAFDFSAITEVWERKGLLYNSQYAFRAKKGTEGPLLLWSLMNDRAYLRT